MAPLESEPSWLKPQLELKDFQLILARDLFYFSSKSQTAENKLKFDSQLKT
jgi:hypothetical protein